MKIYNIQNNKINNDKLEIKKKIKCLLVNYINEYNVFLMNYD